MLTLLLQVKYIEPLLRSQIVSDAAFATMLKLAHCIAPPLCNWALEIAAALRIISTEESNVVWELMPLVVEGENHRRSSSGLFEQIITGLSVACRAGPLPADSFSFVFPVLYFAIWNSLDLTNCGF